ncbi:MBL fold metallo-hydrolase [Christensenellaceae bacterium OttesenSCG-928-K19]|nr:MBL fold metallo-hydrolase [Christensenellaceae bacterium OttesenSCG-928-K19]
MKRIILLGTGNGDVVNCYNTCFAIQNGHEYFLVDAGGGNRIVAQLRDANIPLKNIHDVFVSHIHADHILGVFWVIRRIGELILSADYDGVLTIRSHQQVAEAIREISMTILQKKFRQLLDNRILIKAVEDGQSERICGFAPTFFDIRAKGDRQFGFHMEYEPGKRLVFLGDEPLNPELGGLVAGSDYLMHEAFCLDSQEHIFRAYEKNHSTAKAAAMMAEQLQVKNLILYHTEEETLANRKQMYTAEAKEYCNCNVYVPDDLDIIALD